MFAQPRLFSMQANAIVAVLGVVGLSAPAFAQPSRGGDRDYAGAREHSRPRDSDYRRGHSSSHWHGGRHAPVYVPPHHHHAPYPRVYVELRPSYGCDER